MTVHDGPRPHRAAMWLGHYSVYLLTVPAAVQLAADADRASDVLAWAAVAAWPMFLVLLLLDWNYHERRLCERCIGRTPLDPQRAVTRWDPALRWFHSRRAVIITSVLLFASGLIPAVVPVWPGVAVDACRMAALALFMVVLLQHRRLYPWCPYCRWGGGGEHEAAPEPDPADSKPLPV